jgi:hypothetical protein
MFHRTLTNSSSLKITAAYMYIMDMSRSIQLLLVPLNCFPVGLSYCAVGCSDFGFFHIFMHNNPSLPPFGPKDLEIGPKKLLTSSLACEIFCQKPENAFFILKFKFWEPRLTDIYFFSTFYLWILDTHTKKHRLSLSTVARLPAQAK